MTAEQFQTSLKDGTFSTREFLQLPEHQQAHLLAQLPRAKARAIRDQLDKLRDWETGR